MHKIERLMGIILALNKNKKMTANELARRFEVDIRTIYRDIQALSELNVPIVSDIGYDGGYYLQGEYFIPPIMFSKDEIFSLLLSKAVIGEIGIPGYTEYINSAFLKLESVTCDTLMDGFKDIENRVKFNKNDKAVCSKELNFFLVIKNGLENNQKIRIEYLEAESRKLIEAIIRPYGLIYVDDLWKVISLCEIDGYVKSLDINLIKKATLINEGFHIPSDFNIDNYYCENHCIIKCKNKNYEIVKLRVKKSSYYSIKDYIFFNDGELTEDDASYILTIKATAPEAYIQIAFRFYDSIEIVEPLWLRRKFMEELETTYKCYNR